MIIKTPAKVNITLDIKGKRSDGYHDVYMIMQEIPLYDIITIEKSDTIEIKNNLPYLPCDERNIAYRSAKLFFEHTKIRGGAYIHIEKNIPVGAGLGGGSTNGAGVIMALNEMYNAKLSLKKCMELGAQIGADVPFFMLGGTCLAEGLGEILTPIAHLPKCFMVLAKPPFSVSTKLVYQSLNLEEINKRPNTDAVISALEQGDLKTIAKNMVNVLETVTIKKYPKINEYKKIMQRSGALGALMSGSGSTAFALFDDFNKAKNCSDTLKKQTKDVFVLEI